MGRAVKEKGQKQREAKSTPHAPTTPSMSERYGFRKLNMSGLGCPKATCAMDFRRSAFASATDMKIARQMLWKKSASGLSRGWLLEAFST
jgi:hypothetical protein